MNLPGFGTTSVWRVKVEIFRPGKLMYTTWVSLTLYWKPLVHVSSAPQKIEKLGPKLSPFPRTFKCGRISNEDKTIPCARNKHIETFRGVHEPNNVKRIRSTETGDYYVTFFTLVIIYGPWNDQPTICQSNDALPMVASLIPVFLWEPASNNPALERSLESRSLRIVPVSFLNASRSKDNCPK